MRSHLHGDSPRVLRDKLHSAFAMKRTRRRTHRYDRCTAKCSVRSVPDTHAVYAPLWPCTFCSVGPGRAKSQSCWCGCCRTGLSAGPWHPPFRQPGSLAHTAERKERSWAGLPAWLHVVHRSVCRGDLKIHNTAAVRNGAEAAVRICCSPLGREY